MAQLQTPGSYLHSTSVAQPPQQQVQTALAAFIGYSATTVNVQGKSILMQAVLIDSLNAFESVFGGAYQENVGVIEKGPNDHWIFDLQDNAMAPFFLYQAIGHYFANGGESCYVISIGGFDTQCKQVQAFSSALKILEGVEQVTLVATPESVLLSANEHYGLQTEVLAHCQKMHNRIAIIDVQQTVAQPPDIDADVAALRNNLSGALKYGAAYYPYLQTTLARAYDQQRVTVNTPIRYFALAEGFNQFCLLDLTPVDRYGHYTLNGTSLGASVFFIKYQSAGGETLLLDFGGYVIEPQGANQGRRKSPLLSYDIYQTDQTDQRILIDETVPLRLFNLSQSGYRFYSPKIYRQISELLAQRYLLLPPSAAIAGVIFATDAARGVFKAPANVALKQVLAPGIGIDASEQQGLNVDERAGKSINAIRSFIGKGTLVWGARTLAGNDNEWRYLPVRRLFNLIESALQKATAFAVFEPNTPFTWLKLKTLTERYLQRQWQQGALVGDSPQQAFFVNVGLGQTMTAQDIDNGLIHIEIGLAVVHPAEFIVFNLTHQSQ